MSESGKYITRYARPQRQGGQHGEMRSTSLVGAPGPYGAQRVQVAATNTSFGVSQLL